MTNKPNPEIERAVIVCLEQHEEGLTPTEVSKLIQVQRITATKHLTRLRDDGIVKEIARPSLRIFKLKSEEFRTPREAPTNPGRAVASIHEELTCQETT